MTTEHASTPDAVHQSVVEENIKLHELEGPNYLLRHPEQTNYYQMRRLRGLIAETAAALGTSAPKNLDIACGTGYLLLEFLKQGFDCTGVDLSEAMLASLQKILPAQSADRCKLLCQDIFEFMSAHEGAFDVVSIGAALHHFDAYENVVRWACRSVAPGGWLVIAFEPLKQAIDSPVRYRLHRWLAGVDERIYRISRRLRGIEVDLDTSEADYQRKFGGIDPNTVTGLITTEGLEVVRVDKYCTRRYGLMASIANNWIGSQNTFDVIARKARA